MHVVVVTELLNACCSCNRATKMDVEATAESLEPMHVHRLTGGPYPLCPARITSGAMYCMVPIKPHRKRKVSAAHTIPTYQ